MSIFTTIRRSVFGLNKQEQEEALEAQRQLEADEKNYEEFRRVRDEITKIVDMFNFHLGMKQRHLRNVSDEIVSALDEGKEVSEDLRRKYRFLDEDLAEFKNQMKEEFEKFSKYCESRCKYCVEYDPRLNYSFDHYALNSDFTITHKQNIGD